ncbi:unnamed protein product [Polarella glacialis]|uniref:Serine/threonine specific protein phosphatases domain-containing protein n=1 Tax=Polarella glacialis TaxID=89957 RepID=A0A813JW07_POLGL|nr:unnamed protein product [Polarella glacialis]
MLQLLFLRLAAMRARRARVAALGAAVACLGPSFFNEPSAFGLPAGGIPARLLASPGLKADQPPATPSVAVPAAGTVALCALVAVSSVSFRSLRGFGSVRGVDSGRPSAARRIRQQVDFCLATSGGSTHPTSLGATSGEAIGEVAAPQYPGRKDSHQSRDFAVSVAEFMRTGVVLPWNIAEALVKDAIDIVSAEKTLERVDVPPAGHINVVGDVHGQFFDVFTIFEQNGLPSAENPYVFNGDFVDRGSFSAETLLLLLAWKVAFPLHVRLARGNHESHDMNVPYGFTGEVLTKYGPEAYNLFQSLFDNLPLAHVINSDVLVVHGGLPRKQGVRLGDIEGLDRVAASKRREQGVRSDDRDDTVFTDLLWADPRSHAGLRQSDRGGDVVTFGQDVTEEFLNANGLSLLIRSHEVKDQGFEWQHGNRVLTVFSAPLYCDSCDNDGAVIRLHAEGEGPLRPEVRVFKSALKPEFYVPAMVYSPMNPEARKWLSRDAKAVLSQLLSRDK